MMKQLLSFVLAMTLGTSMLFAARTEGEPTPCEDNDSYRGTCGENLQWLLTCDGELVITGTGAMTDFSASNMAPWYNLRKQITSVSLPDGLTHVGDWSIYQIEGLTYIRIPDGVTSMGYVALAGCRNLTKVTLPQSLEEIGSKCFQATGIKKLQIPTNVSKIGSGITEDCEALESITVAKDNTTFIDSDPEGYLAAAIIRIAGDELVAGCKNTVIPGSVKAIASYAFSSIGSLEEIRIPVGVESIGAYAFQYTGLKNLVIPTTVTTIAGTAFTGCTFESINVTPGNPTYDSRDNCQAIIETKTNVLAKGCPRTVIPEEVSAIGEGAFMSCKGLKFINIPASVQSIAKNALIYCNGLEAITCLATVPPAADKMAFHYGDNQDININPEIPVYVPAGSIDAYKAAENWEYFTNFVALDNYFNVKALATHGKVSGTGTYKANTEVELTAVGDEGFEFLQWTDGTEDNPKKLKVTEDVTVRALFKMKDVEEEIASLLYEANMMSITWDVIDQATIYVVDLYKDGVFFASYKTIDYVNFIELYKATPAPLRARRSYNDELPTEITFVIEGLEYGANYSYNIDAYNDEEEVVNVIAGSFNTAEIATRAEQTGSKVNATRKLMHDGRLVIVLPDGKSYNATGKQF